MFENWPIIILTLALVLVTYGYMWHTRRLANDTKRMADIMAQEFELRIAPFIGVDELHRNPGTNIREYHPVITNRGFLPIHIMKIILEGWSKESPSMIFRIETKIDKRLGVNESIKKGECLITVKKSDVAIDDLSESKGFNFNQVLDSSKGKIYFTYVDRYGKEQRTGDQHFDHL
jgi:hypothetical protein